MIGAAFLRPARAKYLKVRKSLTETLTVEETIHLCESLAKFAAGNNLGLYRDALLEARLANIAAEPSKRSERLFEARSAQKILHYVTRTYRVGGHSRLIAHWIQNDMTRRHDLLAREPCDLPQSLSEALLDNRGDCSFLSSLVGADPQRQARALRERAERYDLIVLHAHPDDVLPILAFAKNSPAPLIVNNHWDHGFWLGTQLGDLVLCGRADAVEFCVEWRNISPERCFLMPWPMPAVGAKRLPVDRMQIRRALGLPEDKKVILTAGHHWKYASRDHVFFRSFEDYLAERDDAVLCVAGDRSPTMPEFGPRIIFTGPIEGIETLYKASDAYVDSFPLEGGMSTLEAFVWGLPILSSDFSTNIPGRVRVNLPGLTRALYHYSDKAEFFRNLSLLLDSSDMRLQQRMALSVGFAAAHGRAEITRNLESLYGLALMRHEARILPPRWDDKEDLSFRDDDSVGFLQESMSVAGVAEKLSWRAEG